MSFHLLCRADFVGLLETYSKGKDAQPSTDSVRSQLSSALHQKYRLGEEALRFVALPRVQNRAPRIPLLLSHLYVNEYCPQRPPERAWFVKLRCRAQVDDGIRPTTLVVCLHIQIAVGIRSDAAADR